MPNLWAVLMPGLFSGLVAYGAMWAERRFMWRDIQRLGRRVGRVEERVGIAPEVE